MFENIQDLLYLVVYYSLCYFMILNGSVEFVVFLIERGLLFFLFPRMFWFNICKFDKWFFKNFVAYVFLLDSLNIFVNLVNGSVFGFNSEISIMEDNV